MWVLQGSWYYVPRPVVWLIGGYSYLPMVFSVWISFVSIAAWAVTNQSPQSTTIWWVTKNLYSISTIGLTSFFQVVPKYNYMDTRHMEMAPLDIHACSSTRIVYIIIIHKLWYFLEFKQNGHIDYPMQYEYNIFILFFLQTHPSQTAFMSSVDLHCHCSYQIMLDEAIAIVCAPKYSQ